MTRATGWRPDAPDPRDRDAVVKLGVGPVPLDSSNEDLIVDVLDQGGLSSCVANAVAQAVRASHVRQGFPAEPLLSRLALYWWARAYHHETGIDAGTFIRFAFAALVKFGFCPEARYPYTDQAPAWKQMPPFSVLRGAYDQKSPTEYHRIFDEGQARVDAVKRALAQRHLVVFGTDVSSRFAGNDLAHVVDVPAAGEPIAGGHAMALVGHRGDVFRAVNSWGTGWGDGGFFSMSAAYLTWGQTRDLWIVEAAPPYSEASA